MIHIKRLNEMAGAVKDNMDMSSVFEGTIADPYMKEAEGKKIWEAAINGNTASLKLMDVDDTCGCLATYLSNFNMYNAPTPDDIVLLVDFLDNTYSCIDTDNEERVARFISSLWAKFEYKGRAFSNIIKRYMANHPTSSLGERIRLTRKF